MTTTTHPSGLPEQEPISPTAVVLCGDESWVNTGVGWESRTQWMGAWGGLRDFAAEKGGATLFDLADLPTGLTEVQKEAVTATWESGDSDETWAELLRVAEMEGAHVMATRNGATRSGNVHHVERFVRIHLGDIPNEAVIDRRLKGWAITVTAPKPVDPTGGDPVVLASFAYETKRRVLFRAEDGTWAIFRGSEQGVLTTSNLTEIERLSAQTIAELMGGAS